MLRTKLAPLLVAALLLLPACASETSVSESAGDFYQGKTITIVVPFSPGGGGDTLARFYAPYLSKHIPGNPDIQVKNVEGGGSITGSNEFYLGSQNADGLTLLQTGSSTNTALLLGHRAVEYSYSDMTPIVSWPDGLMMYTSPDVGVETAKELRHPDKPLVWGGVDPTARDMIPLLALRLLDIPVAEYTFGYQGSGETQIAFQRGEINLDTQTTSAYIDDVESLVKEGQAVPVLVFGHIGATGGIAPDPVLNPRETLSDVPTVKKLYEELHGREPSGKVWQAYKAAVAALSMSKSVWAHPDAPSEAVKALRQGFSSMLEDPDFVKAAKETTGGYDAAVGKDVDAKVAALQPGNEVLDWLYQWLSKKWGADVEQFKKND